MTQAELYRKCAAALRTGFHFCRGCQTICDLEHAGEPHQCCDNCGSHRVQWHPPTITPDEEKTLLENHAPMAS